MLIEVIHMFVCTYVCLNLLIVVISPFYDCSPL